MLTQNQDIAKLYFATESTNDTDLKDVIAECGLSVSSKVNVQSKARFEITDVTNNDIWKGDVRLTVAIYDDKIGHQDICLSIDGVFEGSSEPQEDSVGGSRRLWFDIPTCEFPNGTHVLNISDDTSTDSRSIVFDNDISNLTYNGVFDTTPAATDVPHTLTLSADLSINDADKLWNIHIVDSDKNIVHAAQTTSDSTGEIEYIWDGNCDSGGESADGTYFVELYPNEDQNRMMERGNMVVDGTGGQTGKSHAGIAAVNKHKITNYFIAQDASAVDSDPTTSVNQRAKEAWASSTSYLKHIASRCRQAPPFGSTIQTLQLSGMHYSRDASLRARVLNQLNTVNILVYYSGHGSARLGFHIGRYQYGAYGGDQEQGPPAPWHFHDLSPKLNALK